MLLYESGNYKKCEKKNNFNLRNQLRSEMEKGILKFKSADIHF